MQICKSDNSTQKEWETIFFINNKIFGLNEGNLSQTVNLIINKFNYIYPLSFNMMICQMIYSNLYARINDFDVYFNFLKEIKKLEEENQIKPNIFDVFVKLILDSNMNESYYLLEKMLENNYIDFKFIKNNKRLHFINYLSEEEIIEYYKELSKNDLELQKKYVKEGINPNEIAKIIRNDEIEKLQDISSQTKFDFNQEIEPSLYERCSFVYDYVSLIDYAAFFGSVKCFKHLLMNGAIVENTGKYAVASGNIEIIHLCKQNHSSFKGAYEAAIRFHRNDIFHYVYEKKMKKINLEKLGIECILYNNYEIFSFLLKEGMKINEDIIHVSTKIGNIFLVKHFLDSNHIPIDILISSSESRNVELVKYILDQEEIDINAKDKNGNTALIKASSNGRAEIVQLLLEQNGIDINSKDKKERTALMCASYNGHTEVVQLLLEQKGIDINAKDNKERTALILASYNGHTEIVKLLLEQKDIDINAIDNKGGWTALMLASQFGFIKIVKLLLEQEGIDINAKDEDGWTALMWASKYGHTEIVQLLLEQEGIDINAKDEFGNTALMYASDEGYTEIVKLLLEQKGIDINAKNRYGQTALIEASRNGHTEIVQLLLEQKGIDINAKDNEEKTSLIYATEKGNAEIVELLLKHKGI